LGYETGVELCPLRAVAVVLLNLQVLLPREFVTETKRWYLYDDVKVCVTETGHKNVR
jgi:hypothetical protein